MRFARLISRSIEVDAVGHPKVAGIEEKVMNLDRVRGSWKQLKGTVRIKWARVTADPHKEVAGRREILAGKLQVAYGIGRDQAHRQVTDWQKSIQEMADDNEEAPHRAGR